MSVSSKSTLAKLLATENLRVEHQKVQTAMFDLKNRTLILPIWKDMSTDLYDLLIGHEVGHALYTPAQGWHGEIDQRGLGIKSFLNVLEDARIECKIKDKFPGIRRNFFAGYQELFDKDFFGVKNRDLTKLRFIDRINLHYKVGSFLNVQFSEDEQKYIARIDAMESWDDVAALAAELYELAKSEPEYDFDLDDMMDDLGDFQMQSIENDSDDSEIAPSDSQNDFSADQQEEGEGDGTSEISVETSEDDATGKSSVGADKQEETKKDSDETAGTDSTEQKNGGSNDTPTYNDDPVSITDTNFREMEDTFVDAKSRSYSYGVMRKVNLKDYVVPMDWVVENMRPSVVEKYFTTTPTAPSYEELASTAFTEFRNKNQKYINLMVQEFEMRRRASELARASTAKTGRLDVDRVWAHKISEDLFARNTIVPDGKNHGMLLFLDMSGSMSYNMKGTIEQLVTLMMFCRKVRIPFEVYGFTNNYCALEHYPDGNRMKQNRLDRTLKTSKDVIFSSSNFVLLQFMKSNCSSAKFNECIRNLLVLSSSYKPNRGSNYSLKTPPFLDLASTPLEESIYVARTIADEFRKNHRIEVLNTVFLTDGDGDDNIQIENGYRSHINLTDVETGLSVVVKHTDDLYRKQMANALLELYGKVTGSRTINFFIADCNERSIARRLHKFADDFDVKWRKEWRQKYFHTKNSYGFDDRFLIPGGDKLKIDEDILETDTNDAKELRKAFMKFQNNKQTNRVLLTKMIQAIA